MPLPLLALAPAAAGAIGGLAARFGPSAHAAARRFAPGIRKGVQAAFDKRTDAANTLAGAASQGGRIAGRVGFDRAGIGRRLVGPAPAAQATRPAPRAARAGTPIDVPTAANFPAQPQGVQALRRRNRASQGFFARG